MDCHSPLTTTVLHLHLSLFPSLSHSLPLSLAAGPSSRRVLADLTGRETRVRGQALAAASRRREPATRVPNPATGRHQREALPFPDGERPFSLCLFFCCCSGHMVCRRRQRGITGPRFDRADGTFDETVITLGSLRDDSCGLYLSFFYMIHFRAALLSLPA